MIKSDCYAFLRMKDAASFYNTVTEDMRVFGVCIQVFFDA